MKNYILIALIFIVFSCKKEECQVCDNDEALVCTSCKSYIDLEDFNSEKKQEGTPCFNPNNMDEFVYVNKLDEDVYELVKYDMITKKSLTLHKGDLRSQPHWGKNNIIMFTDLQFQLHIVKPDGSMNKQLTNANSFLAPTWKNDSIIAAEFSKSPSAYPSFYVEYNLNRKTYTTDTLNGYSSGYFPSQYNSKEQFIFMNDASDSIINLKENAGIRKIKIPIKREKYKNYTVIDLCWHPTEEVVYFTVFQEGLYSLNINTLKLIKIRNGCTARTYKDLSISSDGKKILIERVDSVLESNGALLSDSGIYIMDTDGKNERKIEL